MFISKMAFDGKLNPEWERVGKIEYRNENGMLVSTTKEESPEMIQVNEVQKDDGIHYYGTQWESKKIDNTQKKIPIINTHGSDRNVVMKCDMCGKTFSMAQLEYDSNFGWVCKKCEEEETC